VIVPEQSWLRYCNILLNKIAQVLDTDISSLISVKPYKSLHQKFSEFLTEIQPVIPISDENIKDYDFTAFPCITLGLKGTKWVRNGCCSNYF